MTFAGFSCPHFLSPRVGVDTLVARVVEKNDQLIGRPDGFLARLAWLVVELQNADTRVLELHAAGDVGAAGDIRGAERQQQHPFAHTDVKLSQTRLANP